MITLATKYGYELTDYNRFVSREPKRLRCEYCGRESEGEVCPGCGAPLHRSEPRIVGMYQGKVVEKMTEWANSIVESEEDNGDQI